MVWLWLPLAFDQMGWRKKGRLLAEASQLYVMSSQLYVMSSQLYVT